MSDQTRDGRTLRYLCVVDEFTRECLALAVRRSFPASAVMAVLAQLIAERGVPGYLRSDNPGGILLASARLTWHPGNGLPTAGFWLMMSPLNPRI